MPVDTLVAAPPAPALPYRGIAPFRYVDQRIFAEREKETWSLMSLITLYRGALLYGESGTGKSSLIDAGLIPAALAEDFIADKLRVDLNSGNGELVVERIPRSEAEPPTYLRSALIDGDGGAALHSLSAEEFERCVRSFKSAEGKREIPLLIFDQFEELVTQLEEAKRRARHEGEHIAEKAAQAQRRILDAIASLLHDDELPVKLLFVFREDYMAKLNSLFKLYPNLVDQYLFLQAPRAQKLESLIRAPFEKNPGAYPKEFSPELARKLAARMNDRDVGEEINLTELQIVCLELWEAKDPAASFETNKIEKLLSDYLSEALSATGDLQDTAVALLARLVTGSNTRNIISEEDLIAGVEREEGVTRKRAAAALKSLEGTKLVRRELRHNVPFYEIVSEFLVDWIVDKRKKHDEEKRNNELEQAHKEVERAKRRARQQLYLFLLFTLILIFAGVAVWQVRKARREAVRQRQIAEEAKTKNKEIVEMLSLLTSQQEGDKQKALEQIEKFSRTNTIPPELAFVLLTTVRDSSGDVSEGASRLIGHAATNDPLLSKLIESAARSDDALAEKLPPRVSIMFPTEQQRESAITLKKQLEKSGYVVPKIGQVDYSSAPDHTQLRYFLDTDADKAKEVANVIHNFGIGISGGAKSSPGNGKVVRPGQFELWLARQPLQAGADWYVRVKFFKSDEAEETLKSAVSKITASATGGQVTFPRRGEAQIGPYEGEEQAGQVRDSLRGELKDTKLRKVSITIYPRTPGT
jgi:hypothetical protein